MNFFQRVRSSVRSGSPFATDMPDDPRKYLRNFLLHFRPTEVPERTLRITFTWALGIASTVLLMLLMASGLLLKFVYEPTPASAYASIVYLGQEVPFGQLLRNAHRWSGYALLNTAFLHMLRLLYTGSFHAPRQFNWIIGLCLFAMVVLANFTGYLLPWDQISYWAVTISTSLLDYVPWIGTTVKGWILGGQEPGAATLMNFYALHTAILPILMLLILPFHFWRIRKANGIVVPRKAGETLPSPLPMANTVPHLVSREAAAALVVVAFIIGLAMVFNAPLAEQANPGMSPNPTKAPWFFMGIQEILMHFHPVFAALVIPAVLTAGLLYIPYIRYDDESSGVWFCSHKGRRTALLAAVTAAVITVALVVLDDLVFAAVAESPPTVIRNGLLPFLLLTAFCSGFYAITRKAMGASKTEAVQAMFTLLMVSFLTLTMIGTWFRGPGMQLVWAG